MFKTIMLIGLGTLPCAVGGIWWWKKSHMSGANIRMWWRTAEQRFREHWRTARCEIRKRWFRFVPALRRQTIWALSMLLLMLKAIFDSYWTIKDRGLTLTSISDVLIAVVVLFANIHGAWSAQDKEDNTVQSLKEAADDVVDLLQEEVDPAIQLAVFARRGRQFVPVTGSDRNRFDGTVWPVSSELEDAAWFADLQANPFDSTAPLTEQQRYSLADVKTLFLYPLRSPRGVLVGVLVVFSTNHIPQSHRGKITGILLGHRKRFVRCLDQP